MGCRAFRALLAVALGAAGGCVDARIQLCADDGVCGGDAVCAPLGGCAEPEQIRACEGRAENAPCTAGTISDGLCLGGVCRGAGCGNALVETDRGEVCDDGNQVPGDGCRHDCLSDETCGNGVVDLGELCDDANTDELDGCRADCSIVRCGDGVLDLDRGEVCDEGAANSDAPDASCRRSCDAPSCGDGVVDPARGELCDDGNALAGDGCRPDCRSLEVCGNGVIDPLDGEQCDDGNLRGGDGCAATSERETRAWHPIAFGAPPRQLIDLAYDVARRRVVFHGGGVGETWELDGTSWRRIYSSAPLGPIAGAPLVYDTHRQRVVMLSPPHVWTWDGAVWEPVTTTGPTPAPRFRASAAYDGARDRIVVFGGTDSIGTFLPETWELVGDEWRIVSASGPEGRYAAGMVYDPQRGRTVLFGGHGPGGSAFPGTWTYDGTGWTLLATTAEPPVRAFHEMTFDARRGRVVVAGGRTINAPIRDDLWELDGDTWILRAPATTKPARANAGAVFDVHRGETIFFGGVGEDGVPQADTWRWDGMTMRAQPAALHPDHRQAAAIAYDTRRHRAVVYGGQFKDDTWVIAGGAWSPLVDVGTPGAQFGHVMAYDARRDRLVTVRTDGATWELGATWTETQPASALTPRQYAGLVYDSAREVIVLFGGKDGPAYDTGYLGDTWEYDGTSWTAAAPTQSPSPRRGMAMTYDVARARTVLFGGDNDEPPFAHDDTWEYDGVTWTEVDVADRPAGRTRATLTYDVDRARSILVGGLAESDAWEYDGAHWTRLEPAVELPPRTEHVATYDPIEHRLLVFGGYADGVRLHDFWELAFEEHAAGEACAGGGDHDRDVVAGCLDDDCALACEACGDGTCDPLETCRSCPADCVVGIACAIVCGDAACDGPLESTLTCPGDCP